MENKMTRIVAFMITERKNFYVNTLSEPMKVL